MYSNRTVSTFALVKKWHLSTPYSFIISVAIDVHGIYTVYVVEIYNVYDATVK